MSFTQDELQAFNTILEQRLLAHRRELERAFDLRVQTLRREFEQRLTVLQQNLSQVIAEQQRMFKGKFGPCVSAQPSHAPQIVDDGLEQQSNHQLERAIGQAFAAQLPAFEQLIKQSLSSLSSPAPVVGTVTMYTDEQQNGLNTVELQTEIPWDDLVEAIDQALNDRLAPLCSSIHAAVKGLECCLSTQLLNLRTELAQKQASPYEGRLMNMQDVLDSIGQLEHVIESMHVVMTTNHGLLSNRLYQHQHLPLDRAHPPNCTMPSHHISDSLPLTQLHEEE